MKKNKTLIIVLISLAVFLAFSVLGFVAISFTGAWTNIFHGNWENFRIGYGQDYTMDMSGNAPSDVNAVTVNAISSKTVVIVDPSATQITAHLEGTYRARGEDVITLETNNTDSGVQFNVKHKIGLSNFNGDLTLTLTLPSSYKGSLDLGTVSGDIRMQPAAQPLNLTTLHVHSTSGILYVSDVNAQQAELSTVSGEVEGILFTKSLQCKTTSGGIRLQGEWENASISTISGEIVYQPTGVIGQANISTVSGNVDVTVPRNSAMKLEFSTISGDMETVVPLTYTSAGKRNMQAQMGEGTGLPLVSVHTTSGDMNLNAE